MSNRQTHSLHLVRNSQLYVCPLSAVADTCARAGASHLVTCLNEQFLIETPRTIEPANHLRLKINDIVEPQPGLIAPNADHIGELIDFALAWDRRGCMVIHCWAGISRSTAAAFITLCTLNPAVPEHVIAHRLRQASPSATPNPLMVRLADDALGRKGRMVDAIEAIGRGEILTEASPFALSADLS
jgi:predicted protein tyrosine phosphatase